jgi:hypothetical protein
MRKHSGEGGQSSESGFFFGFFRQQLNPEAEDTRELGFQDTGCARRLAGPKNTWQLRKQTPSIHANTWGLGAPMRTYLVLTIVPVSLKDARTWVDRHHRHHKAPVSGLFAIGLAQNEDMVGVAIVGRPIARGNSDGWTAEVTRVAVIEGVPNGCSMLYGACWRAAKALGYRKLITYTLTIEPGTSLKAAGWRVIGEVRGRSWSTPSRPRIDHYPLMDKLKWEA